MQELIEYIARELVEEPDEVRVAARRTGANVFVDLHASPNDLGRLIGRRGRTAQAIRTVARVAGARKGLRITVDIE